MKTIEDIYSNIDSSISNSMFVIAFYDILHKYYIAAIFYITVVTIEANNTSKSTINHIIQNGTQDFKQFPGNFKEFIDEYDNQLMKYKNKKHRRNHNILSGFIEKLDEFGIYIQIPEKIKKDEHKISIINDLIPKINQTFVEIGKEYITFRDMYLCLGD